MSAAYMRACGCTFELLVRVVRVLCLIDPTLLDSELDSTDIFFHIFAIKRCGLSISRTR